MDRARKDLAKRFFTLLYLFLKRNYEKIEGGVHPSPHCGPGGGRTEFFYSRARPAAPWYRAPCT
ncbi:MAG: DUF444 family protein [Candidatus Competibacteraceae bacterium]